MNIPEFFVLSSRVCYRLLQMGRRLLGIQKTTYVQQRVSEYRNLWHSAAIAQGLEFIELEPSYWELRQGGVCVCRINNYLVQLDDPVTLNIAGDKALTFRILQQAGLPIPSHEVVARHSLQDLWQFMAENPGPYVIKPARGTSSGLGVSTMLQSRLATLKAVALAFNYCDEAIVERHIPGESYRLLFLENKFVCAARRAGLWVCGDGSSLLQDLVERRLRSMDSPLLKSWRDDADIRHTLAAQGLQAKECIQSAREVLVRSRPVIDTGNKEIRTVYDEDVSNLICEDLIAECAQVTAALGSEFCGVDVITVDPGRSLLSSGGVVDEVNTTPGLHHHYNLNRPAMADAGSEQAASRDTDIAGRVIRHLVKKNLRDRQ